tara:strand:- start:2113 stop:3273 length:1161 start_codon:yes stop_codon:yes gene_type:complete
MPDISTINGVAAGSINTINGVAKASCSTISGVSIPSTGASLWCTVGADGAVATAAHSDLNDWTGYVSADMGTKDYNHIAYGKDGSGDPLWVAVNENGTKEIRYSSDPTNTSGWSNTNVAAGKLFSVAWGNNVWMAGGQNGTLWRSTDGSTWSQVDMSGATDWFTTGVDIRHMASDGAGTWMCDNHDQIFKSTDDGASWSKVYDTADSPVSDSGYLVRGIAYSTHSGTSRWVVLVRKSGSTRVIYAASSDTSSWTLATVDGSAASAQDLIDAVARQVVAGGATVLITAGDNYARSTDGGQDWTKYNTDSDDLPRTDARDLATDGNGTWVVVHDAGRVSINTNDGAPGNWVEQSGVQDGSSATNLRFPTGGSNVENLDAVAADVYLPV